ncbi:unnamed protein product, partial [Larinioides sclopetarius]
IPYFQVSDAKAVALTESNFDQHVANNDLVFLNFYADWCRFSQILGPIFDEAAETIAKEYPSGKVLFGKIDSVAETNLAQRFKINKYPTLKLLRNGKLMKREYRGQRSLEALVEHVRDLMKDPVKELVTDEDIEKVDVRPLGESSLLPGQKAKVIFNPSKSKVGINDEEYIGELLSYDELSAWTTNRCIPIVREITFENAEELTEEGLPFLILFHNPDDTESPKLFTNAVQTQLLDDRTLVNFLIADGLKFAHPLHHLGKTAADLPLIAIDSFRHMYLFPKFSDIQYVYSLPNSNVFYVLNVISTNPPESTFKKLAPSRNRYTLLRDEL